MKSSLIYLPVFILIVLLTTQCKTNESVSNAKQNGKNKTIIPVIRETNFAKSETPQDFVIVGYNIKNDLAELTLRYNGGCKKHIFTAHFNGHYQKSMPPKATIFLKHDANGDECKKVTIDTIYVQLREMRYDKTKDGSVIIGFNGTQKEIGYNYKGE